MAVIFTEQLYIVRNNHISPKQKSSTLIYLPVETTI